MKRFLLSTLSVLTIANVSFAGNDKGNAGDGLIINNEIVMRDFVHGATFTTIENNADFLKAIPDFKDLMAEIAQANGDVAFHILRDLTYKVIYISQDPLPKKSGIEPLLYFFDGRYLLVSPNFFKAPHQSHILVTEALRPYLDPNRLYRGSTYESRVAKADTAFNKATTYINQNRGAYKSRALANAFEDLIGDYSKKSTASIMFDTKQSFDVRCAALRIHADADIQFLEEYLDLPCDILSKPYDYYQERVLAAKIPIAGWRYSASNHQLVSTSNYDTSMVVNYSSEITDGVRARKRSCEDNVATIKRIPEDLKTVQIQLDMLNAVISLLDSSSDNTAERQIIEGHIFDVKRLKEYREFAVSSKKATLRSKQFIAKELAYCATWGIK